MEQACGWEILLAAGVRREQPACAASRLSLMMNERGRRVNPATFGPTKTEGRHASALPFGRVQGPPFLLQPT